MKYLLFTVLNIFTFQNIYAQKTNQKIELFAYNVIFSGLTAAIGATINSPKKENKKRMFIKGFWQGSVGGVLKFSGKEMLYLVNKKNNLAFAWPAKLLHSAGLSITENAAFNNPFLQNWNINIASFRIDFSIGNNNTTRIRFLPESIYAYYWASQSGSFNLVKSLSTGSIIFQNKNQILITGGAEAIEGGSLGRALVIGKDWIATNTIIAHELVHEYQFNEYQIINTWLSKFAKKNASKKVTNIFSNYIYADLPYQFLPIALMKKSGSNYKSFLEFEAQSSATNKFIPR